MSSLIENYIKTIEKGITNIIHEQLIGIYIHGSYAQGTFKWERSDIDMIVLIKDNLSTEQKEKLLKLFISIKDEGPKKEIEISFLNFKNLTEERHPYSYEFHYSPYWYKHFDENKWQLTTEQYKTDPDLSSHIMNLRSKGIIVCGPDIDIVFPVISEQEFIESVLYDESDAPLNNVDTIMNLCRSYYFYKEVRIISKLEGLKWMMKFTSNFNELLDTVQTLYDNNQFVIPAEYTEEAKRFKYYIDELKKGSYFD